MMITAVVSIEAGVPAALYQLCTRTLAAAFTEKGAVYLLAEGDPGAGADPSRV